MVESNPLETWFLSNNTKKQNKYDTDDEYDSEEDLGECDPNGPRQADKDKGCLEEILKEDSGYCECIDGRKRIPKKCKQRYHKTCSDACRKGI